MNTPFREAKRMAEKSMQWTEIVIEEIKNALGKGGTSSIPTARGI